MESDFYYQYLTDELEELLEVLHPLLSENKRAELQCDLEQYNIWKDESDITQGGEK
jgi:hypothetical protein